MRARCPPPGSLNCNKRPRCSNRIHWVFSACARSPVPVRLPESGRCRSLWARGGSVLVEDSVRSVLAPSSLDLSTRKLNGMFLRRTDRRVKLHEKSSLEEPPSLSTREVLNQRVPVVSAGPLRGDWVLSTGCAESLMGVWRDVTLMSSSQRVKTLRLAAPSFLHPSPRFIGWHRSDWLNVGGGRPTIRRNNQDFP